MTSRTVWRAVVLDAACVLLFVVIGRASHAKGESLPGVASTAWPFLAGLAVAPAGVSAWLGTVVAGMVLRVVSGQGTAFAFVLVALAFLGLFLLGWRALAKAVSRAAAIRARPRS